MNCEWIGFCALKPEAQAAWIQAIASSVALIAVILVSWYEGRRQIRISKLATRPHVTIVGYLQQKPPRVRIRMKNSGLGPAIVKSHDVRLDGEVPKVRREAFWLDLAQELEGLGEGYGGGEALFEGLALSAGEAIDLLDIEFEEPPDQQSVHTQIARISITVSYESIHGEEFTAAFHSDDWRTPSK